MVKRILFSTILLIHLIPSTWASAAVCADEDSKFIKELIAKLKGGDHPKDLGRSFCWSLNVCRYSYWQKNPPPKMPEDFECKINVPKKNKCGLSIQEQQAIENYSNFHYSCLNSYLRQNNIRNPEMDSLVSTLNKALSKLPNYEGIVVRGAKLPANVSALHKKGNIVTYSAFTSTSTTDLEWGTDKFIIISKTGKPIMDLAVDSDEYEVLFKAGTKFKVLDVEKGKDGSTYILKEETSHLDAPRINEEADLAFVKKLKTEKIDKNFKADKWSCPDNKKVPLEVQQKIFPQIKGE